MPSPATHKPFIPQTNARHPHSLQITPPARQSPPRQQGLWGATSQSPPPILLRQSTSRHPMPTHMHLPLQTGYHPQTLPPDSKKGVSMPGKTLLLPLAALLSLSTTT